MTIQRITNFYRKNKGRILNALYREAVERAYMHEPVRRMIAPFVQVRRPAKWVFILGCYNSGTTILREILGAHPDIATLPREGVRFTSALPRPEDLGWTRMWMQCPEYVEMPTGDGSPLAEKMAKDWSPWWDKNASVFVEKSITNVLRIKWLEQNFPASYFIGITRNGYCVAEGIRRRAVPRGEPAKQFPNGYSLSMTAEQWVKSNERLLRDSADIKNYLQIRYEDLVGKPVKTLESIWRFLDVTPPITDFSEPDLLVGQKKFRLRDGNTLSLSKLTATDIAAITPVISDMQKNLHYPIL